jgi:DNA-binding MarR family transcriptional regulator
MNKSSKKPFSDLDHGKSDIDPGCDTHTGHAEEGFFERELKINPDEERLLHAFRQFHTMKPPEMASCGLTKSDIRILIQISSYIQKHPDETGISASLIAKSTHMMKAAVSRSLKQLEASEYVIRIQDPNDRRYTLVSITDSGKEKTAHIMSSTQKLFDLITERLSSEEIDQIVNDLDRLYLAITDSISQMDAEKHNGPE